MCGVNEIFCLNYLSDVLFQACLASLSVWHYEI